MFWDGPCDKAFGVCGVDWLVPAGKASMMPFPDEAGVREGAGRRLPLVLKRNDTSIGHLDCAMTAASDGPRTVQPVQVHGASVTRFSYSNGASVFVADGRVDGAYACFGGAGPRGDDELVLSHVRSPLPPLQDRARISYPPGPLPDELHLAVDGGGAGTLHCDGPGREVVPVGVPDDTRTLAVSDGETTSKWEAEKPSSVGWICLAPGSGSMSKASVNAQTAKYDPTSGDIVRPGPPVRCQKCDDGSNGIPIQDQCSTNPEARDSRCEKWEVCACR